VKTSESSYLTLADRLADTLVGVEPGTRLPSEHDLSGSEGVSRITARAALQELERRHLVRRTRGAGTFAALRIPYPIRDVADPSWSQIVRDAGHEPSYADVQVDSLRAPADLARTLEIPRGRTLTRLRRTGFVDGQPASHGTTYLPADLVPDLASALAKEPSITKVLREVYGHEPERLWSRVEISTAPAGNAERLGLVGRPPAWCVDSANRCTRTGRPLQVGRGWFRADTFQVYLALGPVEGPFPNLEIP
jgi:GntR family transcriptional regulator